MEMSIRAPQALIKSAQCFRSRSAKNPDPIRKIRIRIHEEKKTQKTVHIQVKNICKSYLHCQEYPFWSGSSKT